jgi:hypothetical protein
MTPRMPRLVAISGLIFVALVAASIFVVPNAPDSHASASKDVAYFHAHKTAVGVAGHLILLAIVVGLFFFWYFRNLIGATPATKNVATVGFAGAVLFAASGAATRANRERPRASAGLKSTDCRPRPGWTPIVLRNNLSDER